LNILYVNILSGIVEKDFLLKAFDDQLIRYF